jgi:L-ribulose-5-phosphate 3-epimerase
MKKNPVGIYEKALPYDLDWPARLVSARQAGFDFVEISVDESEERLARLDWSAAKRNALRQASSSEGVPLLTLCLSAHRKYPLGSASPAVRQRAADILCKAIDFCVDVGLRVIQLAGYYVYYEPHDEGSYARYREGLAQGLVWASQAGVMLALENVDGNDVDSVSQAMHFVEQFKSPWFQVYPDIGNLAEHGLDVCQELERGRGHIVGIHVKDTRPGEPRRVPFGAGIVPFVEAFQTLAQIDYRGPLMLEMWNDDSPDSMKIVSNARQWVVERMLWAGLIDS